MKLLSALARFRETISVLIDQGGSNSSTPPTFDVTMGTGSPNEVAMFYFAHAQLSYWRGHSERCQYFTAKFAEMDTFDVCRELYVTFINGMNSFHLLKRRSGRGRNTFQGTKSSVLADISKAITALNDATALSGWNFRNKVR